MRVSLPGGAARELPIDPAAVSACLAATDHATARELVNELVDGTAATITPAVQALLRA